MALAPVDRAKLARVLGLLGSKHAGERDAAGLAAHRLIQARGLAWAEVLGDVPARRPMPEPSRPAPRSFGQDAQACLRRPALFSHWECGLLSSVAGRRQLSTKQLTILAGLVERLRAAGGYSG